MNPTTTPLEGRTPQQTAGLLRALGHTVRVEIILALHIGPATVTDLALSLDYPRNTLSKHLAALRAAGIVEQTPKGRRHHYELTQPEIGALITSFTQEAETEPPNPDWYKDL